MTNPWNTIKLSSYEQHMRSENILQLQKLNLITHDQLSYKNDRVAILGIAGGNGLEHINLSVTKKVYAIDINPEYLNECRIRYSYFGDVLQTILSDLTDKTVMLPKCDLLICNLIIEYLGLDSFVNLIKRNINNINIVSCVIQKNNGNSFVSSSQTAMDLEALSFIHQDINASELTKMLTKIGLIRINDMVYELTNNKEFIRIDFRAEHLI